MQKFKVYGQSVPRIEWKETDGQTDGGDCVTSSHANAVGKYNKSDFIFVTSTCTSGVNKISK